MSIKARIGRIAPRSIVRAYRRFATAIEFMIDYRQYAASSSWDQGSGRVDRFRDDKESLESRLTLAYHGIEKGASFPSPKRPYGIAKREQIETLLRFAHKNQIETDASVHAISACRELDVYNETGTISDVVTPASNWNQRRYPAEAVEEFVLSRHSVRNFDATHSPDPNEIARIVELASTTPSVCNRRSYRAHYLSRRETVDRALALQNGNSGFGHTVPALIVVTARRSSFVGAGERNQRWIDGGLFAMTLVWLLHASGFGTCMLNWSQTNAQSKRLREEIGISAAEDIIVMIALGRPAPDHRVARSPRRPLGDTFVDHDGER